MDFLIQHAGFVFLFITVVFIWWYKRFTKDNYALTSKYKEARNYAVPFPEFLEAVNSAMVRSGFKGVTVSPRTGVFTGKTGFSMSSWMEVIEINCEQAQSGVKLRFLSICALPTQVYAWGKNKRNAKRFFRELEKQLTR